MIRYFTAFALCAVFLSGCSTSGGGYGGYPSSPGRVQQGNFKIGNPYQIAGKWYTPTESYSYDETGISSWYGDEFHGKKTANGEIFDKNALTAAHPTLQIPSLIRVTNLQNGRSAVLRINDRGPFSKSRLIDVSHGAAKVLGYDITGTARVRVQVLDRESRIIADAARKGYSPETQMAMAYAKAVPTEQVSQHDTYQVAGNDASIFSGSTDTKVTTEEIPVPQNVTKNDIADLNKQLFRKYPVSPTSLYIQVGAFANASNAMALKQKLSNLGNVQIFQTTVNGQAFNRVRIGPVGDVPQADALLKRTLNAGYSGARIVVD